jgi:hypothetical protein
MSSTRYIREEEGYEQHQVYQGVGGGRAAPGISGSGRRMSSTRYIREW